MNHKFYIILIYTLLLLSACGTNEEQKENLITETNITSPKKTIKSTTRTTPQPPKEYEFIFEDLEGHSTTIHMKNDIYHFTNIKQPIVMVKFFATWCPPCRAQVPSLSNLQKKFKDNLFILSALVKDDCDNEKLKKFIISQKVKYFVSSNQKENLNFANMITPKLGLSREFPLPLMILFVNGKYFTHYEGKMPEEMIESDIKQLLEKIKK